MIEELIKASGFPKDENEMEVMLLGEKLTEICNEKKIVVILQAVHSLLALLGEKTEWKEEDFIEFAKDCHDTMSRMKLFRKVKEWQGF